MGESDADRGRAERKFLHDLSGAMSSAVIYASLIRESKSTSHIDALVQAHADIEKLIEERRVALMVSHG